MPQPQRVALVTESTLGIGEGIARRLSKDGYAVVLHSRSFVDLGMAMARELGLAAYVQADLAVDSDRIRLVQEAIAQWGRSDVVVNNAGISRVVPHVHLATATDIWRDLHEVNVIAPFRIIAEAEAALRASSADGVSACVVNVSSHADVRPNGASIPYAATKATLNHVTRLLAISLAPDIRVKPSPLGLWIRPSLPTGARLKRGGASVR